jgi:hypothetical protein
VFRLPPVSPRPLAAAFLRVAVMVGVFTLLRAVFYVHNRDWLGGLTPADVGRAMLSGVRFDVAAILMVNGPALLAALVPWPLAWVEGRRLPRALLALGLGLNLPMILAELTDMEFFRFTGRRSTPAILYMGSDMVAQAGTLVGQHAGLLVVTAGVAVLVGVVLVRVERWVPAWTPLSWGRALGVALAATVLVGAGIRGSVFNRPLAPAHAFAGDKPTVGHLALCSTFTFLRSGSGRGFPVLAVMPDAEAEAVTERPLPVPSGPPSTDNVVIIVVEGLSLEYLGYPSGNPCYAPFVCDLAKRSLFLDNAFANGRRTVEAVTALLNGIPSLMDEPYVTSTHQGNRAYGLGTILKERGYATHFFHGGRNGSMFVDVAAARGGVDRYVGMNEYPDMAHWDGDWGIYDHHFLDFFRREVGRMAEPFLAVVLTLTTHEPFLIPPEYRGRFPKGTSRIHESLGYADEALRLFFQEASREPWYGRTLFVLTGDHTAAFDGSTNTYDIALHRVPIIFHDPSGRLPPGRPSRVVHHADVMPTILHHLGFTPAELHGKLPYLGHSALDTSSRGLAVFRASGSYQLLAGDKVARVFEDGRTEVEDQPREFPVDGQPISRDQVLRLARGYFQRFSRAMNQDALYQPPARPPAGDQGQDPAAGAPPP